MPGKSVRPCAFCGGGGKITVWNSKKKTYETITCYGCKGSGKVVMPNI